MDSHATSHRKFRRIALVLGACLLAAGTATAGDWVRHFAGDRDRGRIAYYTRPCSPPTVPLLVIAGGPGSDHRYMRAAGTFEAMARNRLVVMYDQRATGRSAPATAEPTIELWLEDIRTVQEAVGAERIDLLGHSFGGYLAMSYAEAYPERVRSLVLVDSAAPSLAGNVQLLEQVYPGRLDEWRKQRANLPDRFRAEEIALFFSMEFVDPEWLDRYLDHVEGLVYDISVNNALRDDMRQRNLSERLSEITHPALLLHGRFDSVLAPRNSWNIHRELPDSSFRIIERSGHMPFVEQRDAFIEAVAAFLTEREGRSRGQTGKE